MKKLFFGGLVISALFFSISSCSLSSTSNTTPGAAVLFSNASPSTVPFDIYVDGLQFLTNLPYTNYTPSYSIIAPGAHTFQFVPTGSTSPVLLSGSASFLSNTEYTYFSIDTINSANNTVQGTYTIDNTAVPASDSSKIRFMQFSPMNGDTTVDFAVVGTPVLDTARYYNDVAQAMSLDSFKTMASGTYAITAKLHNTSTVLFTSQPTTFVSGKVYTVVLSGTTNYTPGSALALQTYVIRHN